MSIIYILLIRILVIKLPIKFQMTGILYSSLANQTRQQPDLQFFFNGFFAECSKTGDIGEPVGDCPNKGTNVS